MDKDKCCSSCGCCCGCCCTYWALVTSGAIFAAGSLFHLYRALVSLPLVVNDHVIPFHYSWVIFVLGLLLALWNFWCAHKVSKCRCKSVCCKKDVNGVYVDKDDHRDV